ncbi:UNVERIFIED_CONTAM: hypothetical protein FKN15_059083 [Acipenser sinensis]
MSIALGNGGSNYLSFKKTTQLHRKQKKRLYGGDVTLAHSDIEVELINWILQQRQRPLRVTRKAVGWKAKLMCTTPSFKASRGWIEKFMRQNSLTIRAKTTTGQRLPEHLTEKVAQFVHFCQTQKEHLQLSLSDIGGMDETAIWADMPGQSTVEFCGVKQVPILTTGHEKMSVTVCLAAMADGRKLPLFVVFKGKRQQS